MSIDRFSAIACPACGQQVPFLPDTRSAFCVCGHRVLVEGVPGTKYQPAPRVEITEEMRLDALRRQWRRLHTYPYVTEHWDPERAEHWFKQWSGSIPNSGCSCADHWAELIKHKPPVFSSREAFFNWSVDAHNTVNDRLGKPVLTLSEARLANALFDNGRWLSGDKITVGFLAACYGFYGGTETWHRTIVPPLAKRFNVTGVGIESAQYERDHRLGVPQVSGFDGCAAVIAQSHVTIAWGVNMTHMLSPGSKLIAVDHGDKKSGWFLPHIAKQQDILSAVVCINAEVAEYARTLVKCPVHYIPNAVSPDRIEVTEDVRPSAPWLDGKKVVLWAARIAEEKRVNLAVEAALHLPEDWVVVIVGGFADKQLPPNVHAVGALSSQANWLTVADVFLSTASFEGFGLSMGEAMLAGVPVVATPCGLGEREELVTRINLDARPEEIARAIVNADMAKVPTAQEFISTEHSVDRIVGQWATLVETIHAQ